MKKYFVSGEEFETIEEAVEAVLSEIDEDEFDEYLHDEYGYYVDICGEDFDPVEVLRLFDSRLYDDKFDEWKDEIKDEIEDTLEEMEDGDTETLYGVDIERIDDEDEDEDEEAPAPAPVLPASPKEKAQEALSEGITAYRALAEMLGGVPSLYLDKAAADANLKAILDSLNTLHDFVNGNLGGES